MVNYHKAKDGLTLPEIVPLLLDLLKKLFLRFAKLFYLFSLNGIIEARYSSSMKFLSFYLSKILLSHAFIELILKNLLFVVLIAY